jgi:hypothetical protein
LRFPSMAALLAVGLPYFYPIFSLLRRVQMRPLFQQTPKSNIGGFKSYYDPTSLDSLLGMEGNDVKTQLWEQSNGVYANISGNLGYLKQLSKTNTLLEVPMPGEMLPPDFQKLVLVISP